jgi:glutamyl-tRNA reductase
VLVVGAGEMGEGVARALDGHEVDSVVIANRSAERTQNLVAGLPGTLAERVRIAAVDDPGPLLVQADVVFTSVGTALPIIDRALLGEVVATRPRQEPLLIVDLGVPRNVEPAATDLEGLVLVDMDVLRSAVEVALTGRQEEAAEARRIVTDEVERFRVASRARDAAPIVSALRSQAEAARVAALDRQRARRSDLSAAQWEQVDAVTRSMVAKLLHQPTVALKDAAGTPRGERLVEALRTLFDL